MNYDIYQVDAFTSRIFSGNPAAVVPLEKWLPDETLQKIALENNLSETAFFVKNNDDSYHLRWFTPAAEVKLCGHATLASAFILFEELHYQGDRITFKTLSGDLHIQKEEAGYVMDFPAMSYEDANLSETLLESLGVEPDEFYIGEDALAIYSSARDIEKMQPDFGLMKQYKGARGVIISALSEEEGVDVVSRTFYPALDVNEDPVTGSAHCMIANFWADRLGKTEIKARQISTRGGDIFCRVKGDRISLVGRACLYMKGQINVT